MAGLHTPSDCISGVSKYMYECMRVLVLMGRRRYGYVWWWLLLVQASIVPLRQCGDVHCMYLHLMYLRMGCSLSALVAIPLGPFLSASPSNLVRGPGAGAGPVAARWDGMGGGAEAWIWLESRWDEEAERRIHLESSCAVPRAVTDSLSSDSGQLGLGRCQSCFSVSYAPQRMRTS